MKDFKDIKVADTGYVGLGIVSASSCKCSGCNP